MNKIIVNRRKTFRKITKIIGRLDDEMVPPVMFVECKVLFLLFVLFE